MKRPNRHIPHGVEIIYDDDDIIVINKAAGLLTVGTDSDMVNNVHFAMTKFVRKGSVHSRKQLFVVHRLDRDTSGILMFAKNEETARALQEMWKEIQKTYLAIVYGSLKVKKDTITTYLAENAAQVVYSTRDQTKGKLASTQYKVTQERGDYSLLEVTLITGKKNQIRVHMADIGHPIVGDKKYGRDIRDKRARQMLLHAWKLSFKHPFTKEQLKLEAPPPMGFYKVLDGR